MTSLKTLAAAACAAVLAAAATPAAAQVEQYLGAVFQFGQNWCPVGWAPADGRLLSIAQNDALFTLYGTLYGGDGQVTFALPDLRLRMPISSSSNLPTGAMIGSGSRTVLNSNLPVHTHGFNGDDTGPVGFSPNGAMLGMFPTSSPVYAAASAPPITMMNVRMLQTAGGSNPVETQSPVLAVTWCVAVEGIYPQHP